MYEFIIKMPFNRAMSIVIIIFGCLIAPYWLLINWFPEMISEKDTFQIILTCTSISLPPFITHVMFTLIGDPRFKSKSGLATNFKFKFLSVIALMVGAAFYIPVAVSYTDILNHHEKVFFSVSIHGAFILGTTLGVIRQDLQRKWQYAKILARKKGGQTRKAYFQFMLSKMREQIRSKS